MVWNHCRRQTRLSDARVEKLRAISGAFSLNFFEIAFLVVSTAFFCHKSCELDFCSYLCGRDSKIFCQFITSSYHSDIFKKFVENFWFMSVSKTSLINGIACIYLPEIAVFCLINDDLNDLSQLPDSKTSQIFISRSPLINGVTCVKKWRIAGQGQ